MNKFWMALWEKIKNPPRLAKTLTFSLTLLFAVASLCLLLVDYEGTWLAVLVYTLFGLAGVSLAYSVFLIVPMIPRIKRWVIAKLLSFEFTYLLLRNFGFRTTVLTIVSFALSLVMSAFNAYMGIMNRSVWYGALAAYYIALVFLRGGILLYHKGKISKKNKSEKGEDELLQAKKYRVSGVILLALNLALSWAIGQMIFTSAHFSYAGWTIFAYAAYAFYKITMSIINLVRASKQTDLTVRAVRNVNLTDAMVSILALQTALLTKFSDGSLDVSLFNTLTGSVVSLCSVGLGVYMVVAGTKRINKLQKEKENYEGKSV